MSEALLLESPDPTPVDRAIAILGSQAALARVCGVTQPAVHNWVRKGHPLPEEHVLKVEAATGISRHELRPDLSALFSKATGTGPAAPPSAPPSSLADGGPVSPATDVAA